MFFAESHKYFLRQNNKRKQNYKRQVHVLLGLPSKSLLSAAANIDFGIENSSLIFSDYKYMILTIIL